MYCPEHIKFNKGPLMVTMYDDVDIPWRHVPLRRKLNPLRYEVLLRSPVYLRINKNGRAARWLGNFSYNHIRPRLCQWFGIHQAMNFRGGEKYCHHCDKGNRHDV